LGKAEGEVQKFAQGIAYMRNGRIMHVSYDVMFLKLCFSHNNINGGVAKSVNQRNVIIPGGGPTIKKDTRRAKLATKQHQKIPLKISAYFGTSFAQTERSTP
jgi:hypothetical protein